MNFNPENKTITNESGVENETKKIATEALQGITPEKLDGIRTAAESLQTTVAQTPEDKLQETLANSKKWNLICKVASWFFAVEGVGTGIGAYVERHGFDNLDHTWSAAAVIGILVSLGTAVSAMANKSDVQRIEKKLGTA